MEKFLIKKSLHSGYHGVLVGTIVWIIEQLIPYAWNDVTADIFGAAITTFLFVQIASSEMKNSLFLSFIGVCIGLISMAALHKADLSGALKAIFDSVIFEQKNEKTYIIGEMLGYGLMFMIFRTALLLEKEALDTNSHLHSIKKYQKHANRE